MDSLVKQIVEMDKNLCAKMSQEESKLEKLKISVLQEGQKIREDCCAEAHRRIDQIRQQNQEQIEQKFRQTEERFQQAQEELKSAYEKNKSVWVDEIVSRCLNG